MKASDLPVRVRAAGYLGARDFDYFEALEKQVKEWGLEEQFEYVGEVDHQEKLEFLQSIDLFALPTTYPEAKGLSAIEAMASGVAILLPDHGSFPELIEATGGGLLFEAGSAEALATEIRALLATPTERSQLAARGHQATFKSLDRLHDGAGYHRPVPILVAAFSVR